MTSCLLIHGARKCKPALLTPWMVVNLVSTFLATINFTVTVTAKLPSAQGSAGLAGLWSDWSPVFWLAARILVYAYSLLCVYSFKRQLEVGPMKRLGHNIQNSSQLAIGTAMKGREIA